MSTDIIWTAFADPVVKAIIFGAVACAILSWLCRIVAKRTKVAGRKKSSFVAKSGFWIFMGLSAFHIGTVSSAVREISAADYALVLTTMTVKPEMVPPFKIAMSDGKMSRVEYWNVRRYGGLATTKDMRQISKNVADSLKSD